MGDVYKKREFFFSLKDNNYHPFPKKARQLFQRLSELNDNKVIKYT